MQNQNPTNFNNNTYAYGNNIFYDMQNFNQPFFREQRFPSYNFTPQNYQFQSSEQQNSYYSANCNQNIENHQFQQTQRQQYKEQHQRQCFNEMKTYQSYFDQENLNQNMLNNQTHNNCDSLRNIQSRLNDNINDSNSFIQHQNNEYNMNIQTSNPSTTQERLPRNNDRQVQFDLNFDFDAVETQVSNHIESHQNQNGDINTDDNLTSPNFDYDDEPVHQIVDE